MKKVLALVLTFALVFSTLGMAFADTTTTTTTTTPATVTDAKACENIGMLKGDGNGVTAAYLATTPTRLQSAIMFLRLKGLSAEAEAFTGTDTFADADKVNYPAGKATLAYLKAHPELGWVGDGKNFDPTGTLTAQAYYKVLLEALGYKQNTNTVVGDFEWAKVIEFAATKGLTKVATASPYTVDSMATATVEALKATVKGGTITLIDSLVAAGKVDSAKAIEAGLTSSDAAVAEVTANSAKSLLVKFTKAVADTTKVTFEVKRLTTAVTLTATWNTEKTQATLAGTANLPEGTYSVVVKNDGKEMASKTVTISAGQKISKIEITSDKLAIVADGTGYATYKVYDQYSNDITTTYLSNNVNFQSGVGSISANKGLLTITPTSGINLIMFSTVVISGYESTTGVSVTKSLTTSTALGTLSDIKLGSIESVKLVASDVTSVYYIPFTALDMSGNETKNFDLVAGGLITTSNRLSVSNPSVQAQVVRDPANSKNAAIELKVIDTNNIVMNMPVTITAMTYTGKVSSVDTTLYKADTLDTFTLMLPDYNIASNEKKEIPFVAMDQSGNKITKYDDINGKVTFTPAGNSTSTDGLYLVKKVDGSAKLMFNAPTTTTTSITSIMSAVVAATGKLSTVNLTVQKPAVPSELVLDSSVLISAMENGSVQTIDFGYDMGGLKVLDQYGRDSDFYLTANAGYYVTVQSSNTAVIDLVADTDCNSVVDGDDTVTDVTAHVATVTPNTKVSAALKGVATNGGSATVTAKLYGPDGTDADSADDLIDTQSMSVSVIKADDIKNFTITTATAPIFAKADRATGANLAIEKEYAQQFKVYGKTAAGAKVYLASSPVISVAVDNTSDFEVTRGTTGGGYDVAKVAAKELADPAKTSATTNVTVNVFHNDVVYPVTTTLTSSTTAPVAKDAVITTTDYLGATLDGDDVTILNTLIVDGISLQKFKADGSAALDKADTPLTTPDAFFYVLDSYGKKGMRFRDFKMIEQSTPDKYSVDADGILSLDSGSIQAGDTFTVSAITSNGLVRTVKFTLN